jgi:site-specific DNA recombinase
MVFAHQAIELHKENGRNNNTRFYLRGILYCKSCNKKLTAKNDTPKKDIAKKEYLVYRCSSCKGKVKMEDIHSEILNNLSESWPFKVVKMAERIQTVLKRQKKEIIEYRDKLIQELELVTFRENYLISQFEKVTEKADWDFVLSISKSRLKKDLSKVNQFIEHLNLLEENTQPSLIYSLLGKFALNNLNQVELRTLFLSLYKKIAIDFVSGNLVYVDLKFAPFAEIEIYYDEFIKTGT